MQRYKELDILLNVAFPVTAGAVVYIIGVRTPLPAAVRNYLPDVCWAYALLSAMLINWNRMLKVFWIGLTVLSAIVFEVLQFYRKLPGTGDIYDLFSYLLAFLTVLPINKQVKSKFYEGVQ